MISKVAGYIYGLSITTLRIKTSEIAIYCRWLGQHGLI